MGVGQVRQDDKTATKLATATTRLRRPAVTVGLLGGVAIVAAATIGGAAANPAWASSMAPRVADAGTGSGLNTIVKGYSKISGEPFSATYHVTDPRQARTRPSRLSRTPPRRR